MQEARCKISAYLSEEELEKFNKQMMARGDVTVSGYIREMLGFDPRARGRPKAQRQQEAPQAKATRTKPASKEKKSQNRTPKRREQLSFLD